MSIQLKPDESLHKLFMLAARRHFQDIHDNLSSMDVYPGQPPLLRALFEKEGLSQKELAGELEIAPATLTVMLRRMEKNGLLQRKQDPHDKRVSRVFLTEKGIEAHHAVKETLISVEQRCFEHFTEEEKAALRTLLMKLVLNLSTGGSKKR